MNKNPKYPCDAYDNKTIVCDTNMKCQTWRSWYRAKWRYLQDLMGVETSC